MAVTFTSSNFENDLLDASRVNDSQEISNIIRFINSKTYSTYTELSHDIMILVQELDPFDVEHTIDEIFKGISDDHKKLLHHVHVIMQSFHLQKMKKQSSFGCFS